MASNIIDQRPELQGIQVSVRGEDIPYWVDLYQTAGAKASGITGFDLYLNFKLRKLLTIQEPEQ